MMLLQNGYYLNLKQKNLKLRNLKLKQKNLNLKNLKLKQKNLNLKIYKSDFLKLKF
jgi:hypothetical protein